MLKPPIDDADTTHPHDDPDLEVYRLAGRVDHRPGDDEILADAVRRLRIYLYTGGGK
jgi:hypothetical protein